jgi:tripartite-type tricarboxylate transporter receptor subunit TctC
MTPPRRHFIGSVAAACAAALPGWSLAQSGYPSRPLSVVIPYPPGASTDQTGRLVQTRMAPTFGQPVIAENRAGAGGVVGAAFVAKSPADGTRILMATQPILTISPHLLKDMGFDAQKDLVPVSSAINAVVAICVNSTLPVRNVAELIEYGRRNPRTLSFGTAGEGSPQHIGGLLLNQRTGLDMVHIPYKGGGPMVTDLLAGHVKVGIATLSVFKPLLNDPRVRVLAIGEKSRYAGTPDIPTIAETVPGFELSTWLGFFTAGATPPAILTALSAAVEAAVQSAEVKTPLANSALLVQAGGPEALARTVRSDHETYGRIIRDNGIKGS